MVLKVPVSWVWILGFFLLVAAASLSYFGHRAQVTGPGKYKFGTCLRNEEFGTVSQVVGFTDKDYVIRILVSRKYPESEEYRVGAEVKRLIQPLDDGSDERPFPCPKDSK